MPVTIKIALADDHMLMRKALKVLIDEHAEMQVIADAGNGKELLDHLHSHPTELPDVCIIDVKMPVLNGYEALSAIKKKWQQIKVLMLSMFDSELGILKLMRNGADGYFVKGDNPEEFFRAIKQIYHDGIYYPAKLLEQLSVDMTKNAPQNALFDINTKEYTFLSLCGTDLSYKEIAAKMNASTRTIEGYRDVLLKKLNLRGRVGLAEYAINAGILVDRQYMDA